MMELCNPRKAIIKKDDAKKPVFRPNEKLTVNMKFKLATIKVNYIPLIKPIDLVIGKGSKSTDAVDMEVQK